MYTIRGLPFDRVEYAICQKRSHQSSDQGWTDNLYSWTVCVYCGVSYRIETTERVIEHFPKESDVVHEG